MVISSLPIQIVIPEILLLFDWLRAVVSQLKLKYSGIRFFFFLPKTVFPGFSLARHYNFIPEITL